MKSLLNSPWFVVGLIALAGWVVYDALDQPIAGVATIQADPGRAQMPSTISLPSQQNLEPQLRSNSPGGLVETASEQMLGDDVFDLMPRDPFARSVERFADSDQEGAGVIDRVDLRSTSGDLEDAT